MSDQDEARLGQTLREALGSHDPGTAPLPLRERVAAIPDGVSRRGSDRVRATALPAAGALAAGLGIVLVGALWLAGRGPSPGPIAGPTASPEPSRPASTGSASATPSPAPTARPRPAIPPETLFAVDDGAGWFEVVTFDGRHRLDIPEGQGPAGLSYPYVVTKQVLNNRSLDRLSITLRMFDIRTATLVLEVSYRGRNPEPVVIRDAVYVPVPDGSDPGGNEALVRYTIGDAAPVVISEARSRPERWQRGLVHRSPSGNTIASQINEFGEGFQPIGDGIVEVVSLASGERHRVVVGDSGMTALTDEVVFTRSKRSIRGYSIETGQLLWQHDVDATGAAYARGDGMLVQRYGSSAEGGWIIGLIEGTSGEIRRTFPIPDGMDGPVLQSSVDRYVVFLRPDGTDPRRYDYLDLETGEFGFGLLPADPPVRPGPTTDPGSTPDPSAVWVRTAPGPSEGCDNALGGGRLVADPRSGLAVVDVAGDVTAVEWPFGHTARREADRIVVLDATGRLVAREGDTVRFGGGETLDGAFAVCAGSVVVIPDASAAVAETGPFRLTFRIDQTSLAPEDPITGTATLEYLGDGPIRVSGSGTGYFGFELRELTGDRALGPAWSDDCVPSTLDPARPEVQPLAPISGAYDADHPDAAFYRQLLEGDAFRLPPGAWEIVAHARLMPALACAVDEVELLAALRVVVGE